MIMRNILLSLFFAIISSVYLPAQGLKIAVLKYSGGGDWYANPTSLTNLIAYCNKNLGTRIHPEYDVIEPSSPDLFRYPFVHMTGHGNVYFSESDVENLRKYLLNGGFLHADDNYGMDEFIRREFQKLFPDRPLVKLDASHPIFKQRFAFKELPKIHEHDNKPAEAYGIFDGDRLMVFYTYESDLGNGWEDEEVHNDPPEVRELAFKMGVNIIQFVFGGAQ